MAEIRARGRLVWRIGEVVETRPETPRARSLFLEVPGWTGYSRRIDREMLEEVGWPSEERPLVFVCGPTPRW